MAGDRGRGARVDDVPRDAFAHRLRGPAGGARHDGAPAGGRLEEDHAQPLEDRIRAHRLVSQCIVVGDQRPFIAALITLDEEALPGWLESKGKPADSTAEQLRDDPELLAELDAAVKEANKAVSQAEAIKKFRVLAADFTEDNGMLTPSLKLKRSLVHEGVRRRGRGPLRPLISGTLIGST